MRDQTEPSSGPPFFSRGSRRAPSFADRLADESTAAELILTRYSSLILEELAKSAHLPFGDCSVGEVVELLVRYRDRLIQAHENPREGESYVQAERRIVLSAIHLAKRRALRRPDRVMREAKTSDGFQETLSDPRSLDPFDRIDDEMWRTKHELRAYLEPFLSRLSKTDIKVLRRLVEEDFGDHFDSSDEGRKKILNDRIAAELNRKATSIANCRSKIRKSYLEALPEGVAASIGEGIGCMARYEESLCTFIEVTGVFA